MVIKMNPAVKIEKLYVSYDNVPALININLSVPKNDFLAIVGPNGGGKSTLLKVMLGLIKPESGNVQIFGDEAVGYVPQFTAFNKFFPITVIDVILTGRLSGRKKVFYRYTQSDYEAVEKLMDKLKILDIKYKLIGQLSGGQLQKVMIARALAIDPKIILLDEPASSIDAKSKAQIFEFLNSINKNMTIILVTHDTSAVSSYIKNIACLNTRLHYHGVAELNDEIIQNTFGCKMDLIAHGVPHRVLRKHGE